MCIHGLFKKTAPFLVDWEGPAVLELTDWRFTVSLRGLRGESEGFPFVPSFLIWRGQTLNWRKMAKQGRQRRRSAISKPPGTVIKIGIKAVAVKFSHSVIKK